MPLSGAAISFSWTFCGAIDQAANGKQVSVPAVVVAKVPSWNTLFHRTRNSGELRVTVPKLPKTTKWKNLVAGCLDSTSVCLDDQPKPFHLHKWHPVVHHHIFKFFSEIWKSQTIEILRFRVLHNKVGPLRPVQKLHVPKKSSRIDCWSHCIRKSEHGTCNEPNNYRLTDKYPE